MRWWKILGLAAFASVAATGVVIARDQRRRRAYSPEEIRTRLHARLAEASTTRAGSTRNPPAMTPPGGSSRNTRSGRQSPGARSALI